MYANHTVENSVKFSGYKYNLNYRYAIKLLAIIQHSTTTYSPYNLDCRILVLQFSSRNKRICWVAVELLGDAIQSIQCRACENSQYGIIVTITTVCTNVVVLSTHKIQIQKKVTAAAAPPWWLFLLLALLYHLHSANHIDIISLYLS